MSLKNVKSGLGSGAHFRPPGPNTTTPWWLSEQRVWPPSPCAAASCHLCVDSQRLGQQGANCKALWIKAGHLPFSEISVVCVHACLSHVCPCVSEPWCKAVECGLCVVHCAFLADTSQHALPSVCPSLTRTQHTQPLTSSPTGRQRTQLMLSDYFEVPLFKKKPQRVRDSCFHLSFRLSCFRCTNQRDAVWFPVSSKHSEGL